MAKHCKPKIFKKTFLSVLASNTAGGSLTLTSIDKDASLGGSIATIIPDKSFRESILDTEYLHKDLINYQGQMLEKLMLLYSLSAEYLQDFEFSNELHDK